MSYNETINAGGKMNIHSKQNAKTGPFNLTATIVLSLLIWLPAEFAWPAGVSYNLAINSDFNTAWNGSGTETLLGRYGPKVGDLNGDGIDDIIMPEYRADTQARTNNGVIYIAYGSISTATGTVKIASDTFNVRIDGPQTNSYLGQAIWIEDVNEDGVQDIIMRCVADLYFIYGPLPDGTGNILNLSENSDYNLRITPPSGVSYMNFAFGDINNDQIGDIFAQVPEADNAGTDSGSLYVLYGPPPAGPGAQKDMITADDFNLRFDGSSAGDKFGDVRLGDLNGDGALDLLTIASYAHLDGIDTGAVYISTGPFPSGTGNIFDMGDQKNWVVCFGGEDDNDRVGYGNRTQIADLNADGDNDVIIGAYYGDTLSRLDNGIVYVIYGPFTYADHPILDLGSHYNVRFDGAVAYEYLPYMLRISDTNNDDVDDLLILAAWSDQGIADKGVVYIIYGGSDWPSGTGNAKDLSVSSNYNVRFQPYNNSYEYLGRSVILEDLDGDGISDIVLGSSGNDDDYADCVCDTYKGRTYVFYGPTPAGTGNTINFDAGDYHIQYIGGCNRAGDWIAAGDLDGNGIKDILISNHISSMPYSCAGRVYAVSTANPAPKITSPGLFTKVTDPTVTWTSVSGASTYHIQVDDDPSFGSPLYDEDVVATSKDLSGLANGESYYVHVRSTDGNFTRYGAILSFTVDTTAPTAPTLYQPGDATGTHPAVGTQTPEFDWSDTTSE